MTKYPASIDDNSSLPIVTSTTTLSPELFNNLRSAILALEKELGVNPSSTYGNLKSRINYLNDLVEQSGVLLSGDLGGETNDVRVVGLQGHAVSNAVPNTNDTLIWNGTSWEPSTISKESIYLSAQNIPASGNSDLSSLYDIFTVQTDEAYSLTVECIVAEEGTGTTACTQFINNLLVYNSGAGLVVANNNATYVYPAVSDYSISFSNDGDNLVVNVANANVSTTATANAKLTWTKVSRV